MGKMLRFLFGLILLWISIYLLVGTRAKAAEIPTWVFYQEKPSCERPKPVQLVSINEFDGEELIHAWVCLEPIR